MHSEGKKDERKKIGLHPATQQHGTSWYTEDSGSQTSSSLLHPVSLFALFPNMPFTFNIFNKFFINPVFPSKMVSQTFIWNHITQWHKQSCGQALQLCLSNLFSCSRREHSILSTICSCQDQLLLFKLVSLQQVDFIVRMCRYHPD